MSKRLSPCEAKAILKADGIDLSARDYFDLSGYEVGRVLEVAKRAGYRKSKNAPKSTGRAYVDFLRRARNCR